MLKSKILKPLLLGLYFLILDARSRKRKEPERYERRNLRNRASRIKRDNKEVNQKEHGLFGKKNMKVSLANACAPVRNSSHALANRAKVVVEIESNFAHMTTRYGLGQERIVEAQLGKERVPNPAHARDGAGAFGSGPQRSSPYARKEVPTSLVGFGGTNGGKRAKGRPQCSLRRELGAKLTRGE
ncbi:hypothetical protein ACSQ67_003483 [Phaseolus vulgaris]